MVELSHSRLCEVLSYSKETGDFTWRKNGKKAGGISGPGYILVGIDRKVYLAHRLAWFYVAGSWPETEVDHKNCVRTDNSWDNLRSASRVENSRNMRAHADSLSGKKGIFFNKLRQTWCAQICVEGTKHHLGTFRNPDDAHAAYVSAAERFFGEFARAA